jgi:hypothetical protein
VQRCLIAALIVFYSFVGSPRTGALAQIFQAQGPAPIMNTSDANGGLGIVLNNSAASGAIGPVVVDPANSHNMWIGSINGGVWGSTDGGNTWKPMTDKLPSLSIGALALDLSSPTSNRTLVAGFGNFSNSAGTGGPLAGLAMSVDGGADWQPIGGSTLGGHDISGVAVSGNIMFAAASDQAGGLWLSTDHGQNFAPVAVVNGPVTSLAADPAKPGYYYAAAVPAAGKTPRFGSPEITARPGMHCLPKIIRTMGPGRSSDRPRRSYASLQGRTDRSQLASPTHRATARRQKGYSSTTRGP